VAAPLAADPFAVAALVIVAIERESIAVETQRVALGVIAALETRERFVIFSVSPGSDGTQSLEVVVDKAQDLFDALTGIPNHLADVEMRETAL